jgi:hypothetical protein
MHRQEVDVPDDDVLARRKDGKDAHLTETVVPIPVDLTMLEDLFVGAAGKTGGDSGTEKDQCGVSGIHG